MRVKISPHIGYFVNENVVIIIQIKRGKKKAKRLLVMKLIINLVLFTVDLA